MRLGSAWYGFGEQSVSNYFEMAAALGLRYVEVPLYWHLIEDNFGHWHYNRPGGIDAIRETAQEAGVRIVAGVSSHNIAGRVHGSGLDTSGVELGMAASRRSIDIAALLGADVVRLAEPGGLRSGGPDMIGRYLEAYGKAYHSLGDYAAQRDIRIVIENTGLLSDQINEVLDVADHHAVGTLYDGCNYYRQGEDPLVALKNLGQRVYYCHVKDTLLAHPEHHPEAKPRGPGGSTPPYWWICPPGKGKVDWAPILSELATFYDGYICLEHDPRTDVIRGTRIGIEYIRQVSSERGIELEI